MVALPPNRPAGARSAVAQEAAGVGPEPRRVERRDVAASLVLGVEIGREPVGIGSLANEVVARLAGRPGAHALHALLVVRQRRVEQHHPLREPGEPQRDVLDHGSAEIATDEHGALVAEMVVHERVHVARVRRNVVEAVGPDVGVAEAAQVRCDDLEARSRQWLDDAPPDALRLRPAVYEHERARATGVLVHVRLVEAARTRAMDVEPAGIEVVHGADARSARSSSDHSRSTSSCCV